MTTPIKDQIAAILPMLDGKGTAANNPQFLAKLTQLLADLSEETTEVPLDAFEILPQEARKLALTALTVVLLQTIAES